MIMIPVSSSDIASIGYENGMLYIRFISGGLYAYFNVPESVYNGLVNHLRAQGAGLVAKFRHKS